MKAHKIAIGILLILAAVGITILAIFVPVVAAGVVAVGAMLAKEITKALIKKAVGHSHQTTMSDDTHQTHSVSTQDSDAEVEYAANAPPLVRSGNPPPRLRL